MPSCARFDGYSDPSERSIHIAGILTTGRYYPSVERRVKDEIPDNRARSRRSQYAYFRDYDELAVPESEV